MSLMALNTRSTLRSGASGMMTFEDFKGSSAVRSLIRSLGKLPADSVNGDVAWLTVLDNSSTFGSFRRLIISLNNPDRGFWIDAIKRRAGTASTGEFWLLMGVAMLTDFGHVANELTKANARRRTGPWTGMYGCLDSAHAEALSACIYYAATA